MRHILLFLMVTLGFAPPLAGAASPPYPWLESDSAESLESRIAAPDGFTRLCVPPGSFAEWLRTLPLEPGRGQVQLYNDRKKADQSVHVAVVRMDVGTADLQQCADAVIRLRAEYLFSAGRTTDIAFRFTSGDRVRWSDWRRGMRPQVSGNRVRFASRAGLDSSYANFRRYLETIFQYAGTASLEKELLPVNDRTHIEPGDVFIQGGHPGHAVMVVDVAENPQGERVFLLAQSYMPAQSVHILKNPALPGNTWYVARATGPLETPEWHFLYTNLRRWAE